MLARLLRLTYLLQLALGALLGARAAPDPARGWMLLTVPLAALALPLLLQFLVIAGTLLASGAGGFGRLWWRALWGETLSAVRIFMLRQPWPRQPGQVWPALGAPAGRAAPIPVLLVHGYLCNHRVWDDTALALRQAGHPVLALDLEPLLTGIDSYAAQLQHAAERLLAQTGADRLALVGHSMGGLVIRAWMRGLSAQPLQRVARVVCLGSPHQGTRIASVSLTSNGAQMVWRSAWLQNLAASETPAQRARLRIALTRHDNIVFPQTEQTLPGVPVQTFEGMGHLQMCLDPQVIAWVKQQLADLSAQASMEQACAA